MADQIGPWSSQWRDHYEKVLQDRLQEIEYEDRRRICAIMNLNTQIKELQEDDA